MARRKPSRWHGLLPVWKKTGPTSHDVVDLARHALGERRIGHTGTLDPMAEGLLLLCVGKATRLQQYLLQWKKSYLGKIRLGWATDTYDAEGERSGDKVEPPTLTAEQLRTLEARFSGVIDQTPPSYSAKKVHGKKLYELARTGQEVLVEPKKVEVHGLELRQTAPDELQVEVTVSSGFYVRSLAHDVGEALACGGHLRGLVRTSIGPFELDQTIAQDDLETTNEPQSIIDGAFWIPMSDIPLPFPSVDLNPTAADRFVHGQEVIVFWSGDEPLTATMPVSVRHSEGLLGIGQVKNVLARGRSVSVRPTLVLEG